MMPVRHRILLEELEPMVVTYLLPGIDERLAAGQSPAKDRHCLPCIAHPLELGSVPGVLVVVGCESQAVRSTISLLIPFDVAEQAVGIRLALGDVVQKMVQPPGIGAVKTCIIEPGLLPFSEEEEPAGIFITEFSEHIRPEVLGDLRSHVATKTVYTAVEPEAHATLHRGTHVLVSVIEFGDIRPVILDDSLSLSVAYIPGRILFRHPRMVWRSMVGHPVYDDLESQVMSLAEEAVEVGESTEFGIHVTVVLDGIIGAQGSLTAFNPDGIERHDPNYIDTQLLEFRQFGLSGSEGSFSCGLTYVQFIYYGIFGPVCGHGRILPTLFRAGGCDGDDAQKEQYSFHDHGLFHAPAFFSSTKRTLIAPRTRRTPAITIMFA